MTHFRDSKLATLLRLLAADEWRKFQLWLDSPWANTNKHLQVLGRLLEKEAPDFEAARCEKKALFSKLFPRKEYDNRIMNNLLTEMSRQVERFLVHHKLNQDPQAADEELRKELLERQHPVLFEEITLRLIQQMEAKTVLSAAEHLQLALWYRELYFQPHEHLRYRREALALEKADLHLDAFYALRKSQILHENRDRNNILKLDGLVQVEPQLLDHLYSKLSLPALQLYQKRLSRPADWGWSDFVDFREHFFQVFDALPRDLQRDFLFFCLNDATVLMTRGEAGARSEIFQLYRLGLQERLVVEKEQMTLITFNNVILIASHLGEKEYIAQFIPQYYQMLRPDLQEEALLWAKGQLAYVNGQFDTCIEMLRDHRFADEILSIQARVTLLKANLDLVLVDSSHFDRFLSYCHAFEKYLQRNKVHSKERTQSYIRWIQYTRKLAELSHQQQASVSNLSNVLVQIQGEGNLFGKPWLEQAVNRLLPGSNKTERGNRSV